MAGCFCLFFPEGVAELAGKLAFLFQMDEAGPDTAVAAESAGHTEFILGSGSIGNLGGNGGDIRQLGTGRAVGSFRFGAVSHILNVLFHIFRSEGAEAAADVGQPALQLVNGTATDSGDAGDFDVVIALFAQSLGGAVFDTFHAVVTDAGDDRVSFQLCLRYNKISFLVYHIFWKKQER